MYTVTQKLSYNKQDDNICNFTIKVGESVMEMRISEEVEGVYEVKGDEVYMALKKTGLVDFNFEPIVQQYTRMQQDKQAHKLQEIKEYNTKAYNEFLLVSSTYPKLKGVEYSINMTCEQFCELNKNRKVDYYGGLNKLSLSVTYKGVTTKIDADRSSNGISWSRNSSYTYKFRLSGKITEHKPRYYTKPDSVIKKLVELTDNYVKVNAAQEERKQAEAKENAELLAHLEGVFGCEVTQEQEYKSNYRGAGYYITSNKIKLGGKEVYVNYWKHSKTYTIGNFTNLTKEQAVAIAGILDKQDVIYEPKI